MDEPVYTNLNFTTVTKDDKWVQVFDGDDFIGFLPMGHAMEYQVLLHGEERRRKWRSYIEFTNPGDPSVGIAPTRMLVEIPSLYITDESIGEIDQEMVTNFVYDIYSAICDFLDSGKVEVAITHKGKRWQIIASSLTSRIEEVKWLANS